MGVFLVPAFTGLGAPHWDAYARGTIIGLTRDTSAAHLARAALEGVAFQVADLIDAMQADTGRPFKELRVDGGASRSEPLMQFQADLLRTPWSVRLGEAETTALGAAYLGRAGRRLLEIYLRPSPRGSGESRKSLSNRKCRAIARWNSWRSRWNDALARAKSWEIESPRPAKRGKKVKA